MNARDLVRSCLDNPRLLDRIGDDEDLQAAGVNSGEVIRVALRCEQVLGRALTDDEMAAMHSLRGVGRLLSNERLAAGRHPVPEPGGPNPR